MVSICIYKGQTTVHKNWWLQNNLNCVKNVYTFQNSSLFLWESTTPWQTVLSTNIFYVRNLKFHFKFIVWPYPELLC
jgi:hypothetical protein